MSQEAQRIQGVKVIVSSDWGLLVASSSRKSPSTPTTLHNELRLQETQDYLSVEAPNL